MNNLKRTFSAALLVSCVLLCSSPAGAYLCGGIDSADPNACAGNGLCVGPDTCICFTGFGGAFCEACSSDYYDYPNCVYCDASATCSDHGYCGPDGSCVCDEGWGGEACQLEILFADYFESSDLSKWSSATD